MLFLNVSSACNKQGESKYPPYRRNYDECNISEAELVKIDHRFQMIETDVAKLKASNRYQRRNVA